jgi:hypothetical protein
MNKIDISEILKFTPAQEEFSKYIFNGRLGKCLFYRDSKATVTDLDEYTHYLDTKVQVFVDEGLPMQKANEALLELMKDKANHEKPFIFVTTSLFIVRLFQQSLITVVDHDSEGNLVLTTPERRMYYGNINDTIADMYSDNELNMVADAVNSLIDKGNYIYSLDGSSPVKGKELKRLKSLFGDKPEFTNFEKKLVGQIADSFLRVSIERFAKLDGHFPREDDYDDEIHGIEQPFSNGQLHEPLSKRR